MFTRAGARRTAFFVVVAFVIYNVLIARRRPAQTAPRNPEEPSAESSDTTMGNALSEEEEKEILEEAYNLEDPGADRILNSGTAPSNCQPKHTTRHLSSSNAAAAGGAASSGDGSSNRPIPPPNHKHRRASSTNSDHNDQEERRKRQHTQQQQQQEEDDLAAQEKKLSYFQMAKLGYQELVNAIIRPPRADYKVRDERCRLVLIGFDPTHSFRFQRVFFCSYFFSFCCRLKPWDLQPLPFAARGLQEPILRFGPNAGSTWNAPTGSRSNGLLTGSQW